MKRLTETRMEIGLNKNSKNKKQKKESFRPLSTVLSPVHNLILTCNIVGMYSNFTTLNAFSRLAFIVSI